MKTLIFILNLGLLSYAETTKTSLSLKEALQEGTSGSLQLQKINSQKEEASWKRVEATSGYLPQISASASYLTDKKYLLTDVQLAGSANTVSIPAIVPTTNMLLTLNYPLFDGFASTNRYQSAKLGEQSAEQEFDWAQFQTQKQITLQYYKTLASQTLEEVANQNIKTLEDHLKDVNLFKKAGVFTNYDVLRVEVQVSEARSELLNSIDNTAINKNKLADLLGKESETRDLDGKLPSLSPDLIKKIDLNDLSTRKDLSSLASKTESITYLTDANSKYLIPKLSFFGQYQYYNNINDKFSDSNAFREAYQLGLNLTWNLFDGAVSMAKSKQSLEQKYQAEKTLRMAQIKSKQDIELWKRKFLYFCSVYQSRLNDVQKTTESVRLAREGRKVGARTNTDLLDAETELFRAKAGVVNAQVGAIEALINLELATGKNIYQFN